VHAVIEVRDHGPGVPEKELANIFHPFYRLGPVHERHTGGAGLGLAIAERAVRFHGGTIAAANAPGGGLLVTICMPRVPMSSSPGEGGATRVEVPGVQLERDGVGQYMGQRVSNLHRCLSVRALRESSINIHLEQPRERPHQNWPRAPYNMQTPFSSLSRLFNQRSESSFRIPKTLVRITSTAAVFPENSVAAGSPNL
jgi:hypothetical protein